MFFLTGLALYKDVFVCLFVCLYACLLVYVVNVVSFGYHGDIACAVLLYFKILCYYNDFEGHCSCGLVLSCIVCLLAWAQIIVFALELMQSYATTITIVEMKI